MASTKTVSVNAEELRTTFEFVSSGAQLEHNAYICVDTGEIYCHSLSAGLEEEEDLPEDLETSDHYISLPHKNDLGLGRRLALTFVAQELSDEYDAVAGFFRRLGDPAERRLPPSDVFDVDRRIIAGHSEVGADLAPNRRVNDAGMHRIYRMPSPRAAHSIAIALANRRTPPFVAQ